MACVRTAPLDQPPTLSGQETPAGTTPSDPGSPQAVDLLDGNPALERRLLWSYGLGDVGTGMAATLIGFYLFVFYTSAAHLPPAMAGTVLMVSRIWDALNDPLIGWLSDRTRSPWGPRLPWIIWSALPLGIAMAAMWWLPPGSDWTRFWIYVAIAVVANSVYTCVNLPYSALPAELTRQTRLRTRLNTARFTGSTIAGVVGLLVAALLIPDHSNASSYLVMGVLTGVIITTSTLACAWGIAPIARRCQTPGSHGEPLWRSLARLGRNGRFLMVLGLYLLLWCGLQLMQNAALIYLPVVIHLPDTWSNWLLLLFMVSTVVGLQIWDRHAHRHGRIKALRLGGLLWIGGCGIAQVLVPLQVSAIQGGPWLSSFSNLAGLALLVVTIVVLGIGAAVAYLIPWALLPDAIDADPDRPAGLLSAWMVFIQKICIGFALWIFGQLLSISGYQAAMATHQTASALTTIRFSMGLIPALLVVLGLLLMRRWPDRSPHQLLPNP
jgi:GPH family glycoside/pentoside/hexuronide:cation symporter